MLGGVVNVSAGTKYTVYFRPGSPWNNDNAGYKLNMKNSGGETEVAFTSLGNGLYSAEYDTDYDLGIQFKRYSTDLQTYWGWASGWFDAPTNDLFVDKTNNDWWNDWVANSSNMYVIQKGNSISEECYIAGESEITNGHVEWENTAVANKMTYNKDFTYTLNVNDIVISEGAYGFKPYWNSTWIGSDKTTGDLTTGFYSLKYTYNLVTQAASVVCTKKEDITTITYNYYLWDIDGLVTDADGETDHLMSVDGTTASFASTYDASLTKDVKYKFKVVKAVVGDGTEYEYITCNNSSDPAGDGSYAWVYTPTKTRAYNVTYTYNTSTNAATASGDIVNSIYIVKSATEGTWTVGDMLTIDGSVYSGTISSWANKWFAIAHQDALNDACDAISDWGKVIRPSRANGGDTNFDVDFANYTNEDKVYGNTGKVWYVSDGNDSNINISYNSSTGKWSIQPYRTTSIGAAGYATWSNGEMYAIDNTNVEDVYVVSANNTSTVTLTSVKGYTFPAGEGVIIKGSGTVTINAVASDATPATITTNYLVGSGNSSTTPATGDNYYVFSWEGTPATVGFYKAEGGTLAAHKAYLDLGAGEARGFLGFDFDETTGISNLTPAFNEGAVYDMQGRKVAQPTKGLYIINGKKVVIK